MCPIETLRDLIARIRPVITGVVRPVVGGTSASAANRFRIVS